MHQLLRCFPSLDNGLHILDDIFGLISFFVDLVLSSLCYLGHVSDEPIGLNNSYRLDLRMLLQEAIERPTVFKHDFGSDSEQVNALVVSEAFLANQGEADEELMLCQGLSKLSQQGFHLRSVKHTVRDLPVPLV